MKLISVLQPKKKLKRIQGKIVLKSPEELALMRKAGIIVYKTLKAMAQAVQPGVSEKELDALADELIRKQGAVPSFKGYRGYPASICVAVNDAVVHGIPTNRRLKEGDIIGIDLGACFEGYHADTAVTFAVGAISEKARRLMRVASEALYLGIEQARPGRSIKDIAGAVQRHVERQGYGVVRDLVGHATGKNLHEAPEVPNYVSDELDCQLQVGMTLCIEPMITAGDFRVKVDPDGWTFRTADGSLSAHFEHTVAVTKNGPFILTCGPNGEDELWRVP